MNLKKPIFNSKTTGWFLIAFLYVIQLVFKIMPFDTLNFLSWDVYGYYSYLPFNLIHHDIGMQNQDVVKDIFERYNPSSTYYQAFQLENGNWISSYSIGMSFLYLPFFLIAHTWTYFSNYSPDGFSYPYQVCISMGMLIYFSIGIIFLRKLLLRFFEDKIVVLTMLILILGTNIFQEAFNDGLEPHNILFASYCILMYLLDKWYEGPTRRNSMILGALLGFILMIRGSEVVCGTLVVLWGVNSRAGLHSRFFYIRNHLKFYLMALGVALLVFSPQIMHWKIVTGHWVFNNYKMAEGFNLLRPNLIDFFFSFKKGVLIYTPMLIFAIAGLFTKSFRNSRGSWAISAFLIFNTYLISCWLVWWGATSFSSRYFAQSLSLFALPLGFIIKLLSERKWWLQIIFYGIVSIFVFLNLFQSWQFMNGILHGERMTYKYYKAIFLKTEIPDGAWNLLEPDLDLPGSNDFPGKEKFNRRVISYLDFDSLNTLFVKPNLLDSSRSYDGKYSLRLNADNLYSPTLRVPMNELTDKDYVWIGVELYYLPEYDLKENPASLVVHMEIKGNCRSYTKYRALDFETLPYQLNEWNKAEFFYLTPRPFSQHDKLWVYLYNRSSKPVFFDKMKVVVYEPK